MSSHIHRLLLYGGGYAVGTDDAVVRLCVLRPFLSQEVIAVRGCKAVHRVQIGNTFQLLRSILLYSRAVLHEQAFVASQIYVIVQNNNKCLDV